MNSDDPNTSLEAAYRGVNRGLLARIHELEKSLNFWSWYGILMTAVCIILTALKCSR